MNINLLHFTASWCQSCKQMEPIVSELLKENPEVTMEVIDVEKEPKRAEDLGVQSLPTYIFMINDIEKTRIIGTTKKDEFSDTIKKCLRSSKKI